MQALIDPATAASVKLFLARVRGRYPVAGALLFGSRAKGRATAESDADLAIILKGKRGRSSAVGAEMGGDAFEVLLETGVFVSALPIWEDDWSDPSRHSNPYLIATIKREGIPV